MEKVLSEKNKQIRAQQKHSRGLSKKRRVVYPSFFVRDGKSGRRIPFRKSTVAEMQAQKEELEKQRMQQEVADEMTRATNNAADALPVKDAATNTVTDVGTIAHDRAVLDETPV